MDFKFFESINIDENIDKIMEIDLSGNYIFLYTDRNDISKISIYYTSNGYIIKVHYDEDYRVTAIDKSEI